MRRQNEGEKKGAERPVSRKGRQTPLNPQRGTPHPDLRTAQHVAASMEIIYKHPVLTLNSAKT